MPKYTMQDIDVIRRKSGISYNEAVSLLKYHNGSLSQALLDLEKNGRILEHEVPTDSHARGKRKNVFQTLFCLRVKVKKDDITIINLSILFLILVLLFSPWIIVIGFVFALVLGYRIRLDRKSREFADISLEDTLRHAGENIKHTVDSFIHDADEEDKPKQPEPPQHPRAESPASGTKPVDVELPQEGEFSIRDDADGFHEASIR